MFVRRHGPGASGINCKSVIIYGTSVGREARQVKSSQVVVTRAKCNKKNMYMRLCHCNAMQCNATI